MFRLKSKTFDGKVKIVFSGYRPIYDIRPGYWTSTLHEFVGVPEVKTGEEAIANVWFITPGTYQHSLWVGRVLTVAEGSRMVGTSTVLEIFNEILEREKTAGGE